MSTLTRRFAAYPVTLTQARCLSILTLSDSLPSILTLSGSLPMYSHTIRLAAIYSHSIRFTLYLFSQYQAHSLSILTVSGSLSIYSHTHVTVYLSSHQMPLRLSCMLAHHCIRALWGSLPIYSCTQTSYLSGPTPRYPVPIIRLAAYLALVYCLATARLTTNVLSRLSSCSSSYPSSLSDLLPI